MNDIIVIGAGVAGMTAALNALRSGNTVLVLEKENCGGQISKSPRVENFPSIKQISGTEFADKLMDQILDLGAQFELENVESVEKSGDVFIVNTDYGKHEAKAVIIANGVTHRKTGVEGEDELIGHGVSYCALCDGAFYAGEEVALIGDANTALQYALLLSGYCKKVTILTLPDRFLADDYLVRQLVGKPNIESYHSLSLRKFITTGGELSGLEFAKKDGTPFTVRAAAVFIAIGHVPDNARFAPLAELDKQGYFKSGEDCTTKTPGLFVAGDCRAKSIRQLVTASADGAIAGTSAAAYVGSLGKE